MKRVISKWLLPCFALLTVQQVSAATIEDLITLGLARSPELAAQSVDQRSLAARADAGALWENPLLELGAETKTKPGGETAGWRVGLAQPLVFGGTLSLRRQLAISESEIASLEVAARRAELSHKILTSIYEFKALEEKSVHASERLQRYKTIHTYLRSRPFAAPQKRAEASIVNSKLRLLATDLAHLASEREAHWEELNGYLALPNPPTIQLEWLKQTQSLTDADLEQKFETANIAVRTLRLRWESRAHEVALARNRRWSGATLSVGFGDSQGYDPERVVSLGVALPLPVFNAGAAEILAATFSQSADELRLKAAREQALAQLRAATKRYRSSAAALETLPFADLRDSELEMTAIDRAFRRGQVDLLTYLEADAQHSDYLNATYDTQIEFIKNRSEILTLVAEPATGPMLKGTP